jgi:D-beta-D-heptose 7-phosphate kinase/D-beta-D-heptose 1-phosphate adenosyltransferase
MFPRAHSKIKGRNALVKILREARRQGKKVVFTNGCFDLLHVGHVRYLERARRLGDLLVVGLNSDASVRRLKGPKRPFVRQQERSEVLGALACVDYVILFKEKTPLRLIEALAPDVLVKGSDWAREKIVGGETVKRNGGHVARIRMIPGASTTKIVERIVRRHRKQNQRL